jgi:hypothetical protein
METRGYPVEQRKGEINPNAKLTNEEARRMRERRKNEKLSYSDLARIFMVSQVTVSFVIRGLSYRDAGGPLNATPGEHYRSRT